MDVHGQLQAVWPMAAAVAAAVGTRSTAAGSSVGFEREVRFLLQPLSAKKKLGAKQLQRL